MRFDLAETVEILRRTPDVLTALLRDLPEHWTAGNEGGVASVDGMIEAEQVADTVIEALAEERFLVLPHPEVAKYIQNKANDYDHWLRGMRRLNDKYNS